MTIRWAKILLLAAIAVDYTLVVFDNLTDFGSNYQFVRHVLMMDSTFPGNHGMWRAISSPAVHVIFYGSIIVWEAATTILLWWSVVHLARARPQPPLAFNSAKRIAVIALTSSLLMWLVAFIDIGGEWFLMWQSRVWNGQESATRMFLIIGIVLLLVLQPDTEAQP